MVHIGEYEIPTWICIGIPLVYLLYRYLTPSVDQFKKMGIPYLKPYPLVGSLMGVITKGMMKFDDSLKQKHGKVVGTHDGYHPTLMVYDLDMLKEICVKHFQHFQDHKPTGISEYPVRKLLSDLEGEHWKHVRTQLTPTFSGGKLRQLTEAVNRCCRNLVGHLEKKAENEVVELKDVMGHFTINTIAGAAFGIDIDSHKSTDSDFMKHANVINDTFSKMSFRIMVLVFFPWLLKYINLTIFPKATMDFFLGAIAQAMERRRKGEGEKNAKDFLQLMVDAHVDDPEEKDLQTNSDLVKTDKGLIYSKKGLTHEEILAQSIIFFIAGMDTTSIMLSFLCYNLTCHPEAQEKVYQEIVEAMGDLKEPNYDVIKKMPYLQMCIEETTRLYPSTPRSDRMCTEDVVINGMEIKKGTVIGIPIWTIHRDPENYPDPDKFIPERFSPEEKAERHPMAWLPFGQGPRNCVGMRLALMETKFVIVHLLLNFRLVTCEETQMPSEIQLEKIRVVAVNGLKIKFEKRN